MDLDPIQCVIRLREKGGTERWQPVSRTLTDALLHHHRTRGGAQDEQLLRYRNGQPVGYTHYDRMWQRLRRYIGHGGVVVGFTFHFGSEGLIATTGATVVNMGLIAVHEAYSSPTISC